MLASILPADLIMKEQQINSQSVFDFDVEFCRPFLPHNQIICLHHFNSRSLYFQYLQSLPSLNPVTYVGNLTSVHFISMNK